MGLPAYLLEQPKTKPIDTITRQICNLGFDVELSRAGSTLTVRNLDAPSADDNLIARVMRLITNFADAHHLSVDAIVYPIHGNMISRFEQTGFQIHVEPGDDADDDRYTLLRRPVRN